MMSWTMKGGVKEERNAVVPNVPAMAVTELSLVENRRPFRVF